MPNGTFVKPLHVSAFHQIIWDTRNSTLVVDGITLPLDEGADGGSLSQQVIAEGDTDVRGNLIPNFSGTVAESTLYRDSTDFNSKAIKALRKEQPKVYKLKLVETPFATKVRVWNSVLKHFVTKREPGKAWRLRREKSKLKLSGLLLLTNELVTTESKLKQNWVGEIIRHMTLPVNQFNRSLAPYEVDQEQKVKRKWKISGDLVVLPLDENGGLLLPDLSFGGSPWISQLIPNPASYAMDDRFDFFSSYFDQYEEIEEIARSRLFKKLKDQKLDLATDMAEIAQTVGMIAGAAGKLTTSFALLKKGNVLAGTKVLFPHSRKDTANVFLAYRYGVSPLMGDTSGAAEHLAQRILNMPPVKVKGKMKGSYQASSEVALTHNGADSDSTITVEADVTVKYSARYTISHELLRELSRLGITNPTNVAWELVPFSFVVDWLLPIGNYLSQLTTLEGLTLKEVVRTTLIKETITCSTLISGFDAAGVDYVWSVPELELGWQVENTHFTRHILTDTEKAALRFPPPHFKNPFSTGHVANAAALIQQMIRGK